MFAQGQEAVVGKTSRVVEEVTVGKRETEHTQVQVASTEDWLEAYERIAKQHAGTFRELAK